VTNIPGTRLYSTISHNTINLENNLSLELLRIKSNSSCFSFPCRNYIGLLASKRRPTSAPGSYEFKFSFGFSLQSCYAAAALIFEGVDRTLETHTRTYEPGYLYDQIMTKLSLKSSQHPVYVSHFLQLCTES
jgi:hypothetical protein